MSDTPNLKLPYMLAAQAQKHVTHNEALRMLDAVVQLTVLDRDLAAPPGAPTDGDRYIVAASPTGAWAGHATHIAAYQDSAWMFYAPKEGWSAWLADENAVVVFDGTAWALLSSGGSGASDHGLLTGLGDDDHAQYHNNARGDARYTPIAPATLGINATADTTNRLAVSAAATLLNHAGNGHQVKINKAAAGDTASFLFQTGFSGRAEIGTTGDDKFHFKMSSDGSSWVDALTLLPSGNVGVNTASPDERLKVAGYTYIAGEGTGLIVDADGYKRFGIIKASGYDPEFRFATTFVMRGITAGTIKAPTATTVALACTADGKVGIGVSSPSNLLQLASDSAAKPSTNTWTISSDARLKENIVAANLDRCWEIVKSVPLKRYTWKQDAYTSEQVPDRSKLGWIAQDVQPFFRNAVSPHVFHCPPVEDGVEEYQEQESIERLVEREISEIEVRDGRPVRVEKTETQTVRQPVFDTRAVFTEDGMPAIAEDGTQITHQVPRMITRTRPKVRTETIDDCLSLNADQIYAAMYGALQLAMQKIEGLEQDVAEIRRGAL